MDNKQAFLQESYLRALELYVKLAKLSVESLQEDEALEQLKDALFAARRAVEARKTLEAEHCTLSAAAAKLEANLLEVSQRSLEGASKSILSKQERAQKGFLRKTARNPQMS